MCSPMTKEERQASILREQANSVQPSPRMALTELETKVYNTIKEIIEFEDLYCVHVKGIWRETDLSIAQVKGCIGSLIKKGAVAEVELNHFEHLEI